MLILSEGTASQKDSITNSFVTRADAAQFVLELLEILPADPTSIILIRLAKSGEYYVHTTIIASSGVTLIPTSLGELQTI